MARPLITLITDFGLADAYVGIMKGVILDICPDACIVDLTHEIRPQAIHQAAYLLHTAVPYFAPGTVHVAVVDPGVGTMRRPIAVQTARSFFVAPDNGILDLTLTHEPARRVIQLTKPEYQISPTSDTFHGRDIFAPAAAHLARGVPLLSMGNLIDLDSLSHLPSFSPERQSDGRWRTEVVHIDRFGNLITGFRCHQRAASQRVWLADIRIDQLSKTFSDVGPGEILAYVGSSGHLEIAIRGGHAAQQIGADLGMSVWIEEID